MALVMNAMESQNASNAPLSSTLVDISHLLVAAPYRPNTATEITPAQCQKNWLLHGGLVICERHACERCGQ